MKVKRYMQFLIIAGIMLGMFSSCEDDIQVGNLAVDMKYKDTRQSVVAGLGARVGEFVFSKSSLPLTFEIVHVTEENGGSTQELFEEVKVAIFTQASSSTESEEMQQGKRDTVMLPAVEVEKHTGEFILHEGNHIKEGTYHFDVKITNVTGEITLNDVFILEVLPYNMFSFREFGGAPTIERVADSPNQIIFQAYDAQTNEPVPAKDFHFMDARESGFAGIFAGDTEEGEIWNVQFPVKPADTQVVLDGRRMYMDFALGVPGKYVIKMYK